MVVAFRRRRRVVGRQPDVEDEQAVVVGSAGGPQDRRSQQVHPAQDAAVRLAIHLTVESDCCAQADVTSGQSGTTVPALVFV